jgi:hypothetical protein
MRTLITTLFILFVFVGAADQLRARRRAAAERTKAEALVAKQEAEGHALEAAIASVRESVAHAAPTVARDHCEQLRRRPLPDEAAREVDMLCEWATLGVLREVAGAARPDFVAAVDLASGVLAGSRSGAEPEAAQLASALMGRHLALVREALEARDFTAVRTQLPLVTQLYAGDAGGAAAVRTLKQDLVVALARVAYAAGDIDAVLQLSTEVAGDAPLPVQGETARLVDAAVATAVEARHATGDVATAYEFLEDAVQRLGTRPALVRAVEQRRAEYVERVFGKGAVVATRLHLAPAVGVDHRLGPDAACITITNSGTAPLSVSLRGSSSEDVTIPPGSERRIDVRPGRLLALVVARAQRTAAAITTLDVAEGGAYRQVVHLQPPDVTPASGPRRGGRRQAGRRDRA